MTFIEMEHIPSWFKVALWHSFLMYISFQVVDSLCGLDIAAILECAVVFGHSILDIIITVCCALSCLPTKCLFTPEGSNYSGGEVPVRPILIVCEQAPPRVPPGQ